MQKTTEFPEIYNFRTPELQSLASNNFFCLYTLYTRRAMNETLYSWTFKLHKVVRQQNSGVVEDFVLSYSAVYLRIQKWKNYWN